MSEEANKEISSYLRSPASFVYVDKKFQSGIANDLTNLLFFNLTRKP